MTLCDNMAAVLVLQSGKGKNSAILDSARGAWMVQALFDPQITYAHIAGEDNGRADRLSRAHISEADYKKAKEIVDSNQLKIIHPCTVALDMTTIPIYCRSGRTLSSTQGSPASGTIKGHTNMEGP